MGACEVLKASKKIFAEGQICASAEGH